MFRLAAKWANITSLCDEGAIHHYGEAITSLRRGRDITLYKQSNFCYNITASEVLLGQENKSEAASYLVRYHTKNIDTDAKMC